MTALGGLFPAADVVYIIVSALYDLTFLDLCMCTMENRNMTCISLSASLNSCVLNQSLCPVKKKICLINVALDNMIGNCFPHHELSIL